MGLSPFPDDQEITLFSHIRPCENYHVLFASQSRVHTLAEQTFRRPLDLSKADDYLFLSSFFPTTDSSQPEMMRYKCGTALARAHVKAWLEQYDIPVAIKVAFLQTFFPINLEYEGYANVRKQEERAFAVKRGEDLLAHVERAGLGERMQTMCDALHRYLGDRLIPSVKFRVLGVIEPLSQATVPAEAVHPDIISEYGLEHLFAQLQARQIRGSPLYAHAASNLKKAQLTLDDTIITPLIELYSLLDSNYIVHGTHILPHAIGIMKRSRS
jgi:hypothetical protein